MNRQLLVCRRRERRRRPNLSVPRVEEGLLERKLERGPTERFHHVIDRLEARRLLARRFDTDAEDRHPREPLPQPVSQPQTRFGRRLEQHEVGRLAFDQLSLADRCVTESQDEKLEERPVRRIGIDDENGRHGPTVVTTRGERG
jgi:hypothetical protein